MKNLLRFLQWMTVVVWVGGLVFFAFVLAPTAFRVLPTIHLAGEVVGASLRAMDWLALGCGVVFLVCACALPLFVAPGRGRAGQGLPVLLVSVMLLATAYLHWRILPAMEQDRLEAGGDIALAAPGAPARLDFDRLHHQSERLEGGVLLVGICLVGVLSWEPWQRG